MLKRIEQLLSRQSAPLWLGLLAFVLCLPALGHGLQADDVVFRWALEQGSPAWFLFRMEPETAAQARAGGALAWWASPHLEIDFFRPLTSLTHALDFTLWPNSPGLMRLFNALIYAGAVVLAARLYRRFAPSLAIAGLAGLMFALDAGHAYSAGWISGRNTLLAMFFALLALEFHARARDTARTWNYVLSTFSVVLALLSAEAGSWALGLLLSYALAVESGSFTARLRSIAAPLAVGAAWAAAYLAFGYGLRGASFYRDPSSPIQALLQGMLDLPVWFAEQFAGAGYPFALLDPALWVRLCALPLALALSWVLWPALRRSRECRFFALACGLCFAPLIFTLPMSRVLLGSSFGALGWVACTITQGRAAHTFAGRVRASSMLLFHVWIAGLLFIPSLNATQAFAYGTEKVEQIVMPQQDTILIQTPAELLTDYAFLSLALHTPTEQLPRSIHQLYAGSSELWVERIDPRTLDVTASDGWGHVPIERIFCSPEDMPKAGSEVRVPAFSARVLESNAEGMPKRVRFTFPSTLESSERQWFFWDANRPEPFRPPPIGERVRLAPLSFRSALRP